MFVFLVFSCFYFYFFACKINLNGFSYKCRELQNATLYLIHPRVEFTIKETIHNFFTKYFKI